MAFLAYLLLLIKLPLRLSFKFGLINTGILTVLLGWKTIVVALSLAFFLWSILAIALYFRNQKKVAISISAGVSSLLLGSLIFIFYKLNMENNDTIAGLIKIMPWAPAKLVFPVLASLSFSYVFLRCIDLCRSVVWGGAKLLDPVSLFGYITPFHMLAAGPINFYEQHVQADEKPSTARPRFGQLLSVANEITTGLFYKFVLAEGIKIYVWGMDGTVQINSWLDTGFFFVYLFFDFAGYSKVALGLGRLYGVRTPENFSSPFLSCSMTEFWTRWHMSLGIFIRNNVFFPLQVQLVRRMGIKRSFLANVLTLMVSFGMVGLWHRLTWEFLVWGLANGVVLAIEKVVRDKYLQDPVNQNRIFKAGTRVLGPAYVFIIYTTTAYFVKDGIFMV